MTLEELYRVYPSDTAEGGVARELIVQTNWFLNALDFDPVSGEALSMSMSDFLTRVLRAEAASVPHDRLWKIVDFAEKAFRRIVRSLNEQPRTDHARMHVSKVREMDAASFVKLANRTGRTIREKLANDPFVTSVRHFQSTDVLENQLVKAFALRMEELLKARAKAFDEEEPFLVDIRNWLNSDGAKGISRWRNLPPNNALLSHRDYSRIWKAWRWLQSLDEDIDSDCRRLEQRRATMDFWERVADLFSNEKVTVADIPLQFDYNSFEVSSLPGLSVNIFAGKMFSAGLGCLEGLPELPRKSLARHDDPYGEATCVDLLPVSPVFSAKGRFAKLQTKYIWQTWEESSQTSYDISLGNTTGVWTHDSAITVTAEDLYLDCDKPEHLLERAARSFCETLRCSLTSQRLAWLTPDCVSDFELGILRRNINACFDEAVPVPRSIAAVYERVDARRVYDGMNVLVVDMLCNRVFATRLTARGWTDGELLERVPESGGVFWERQPTVELTSETGALESQLCGVAVLDNQRRWISAARGKNSGPSQSIMSQYVQASGMTADVIVYLSRSPVVGGARLCECQRKAGRIPLWKDLLPDLSIGAATGDGRVAKIPIVSDDTLDKDIEPLVGRSKNIKVDAQVILPAGSPEYRFRLYQGSGSGQLRYLAVLSDPNCFPLPYDVSCRLELKYTYGDNDPYSLSFIPETPYPGIPARLKVEWRPLTVDEELADVPVPGFPSSAGWDEIRYYPSRKGRSDLISMLRRGIDTLAGYEKFMSGDTSARQYIKFDSEVSWRTDDKGKYYFVADVNREWVRFYDEDIPRQNTEVNSLSFDIAHRSGFCVATEIAVGYALPKRPKWPRTFIRYPQSVIFSVERNDEMPDELRKIVARGIPLCDKLLSDAQVPPTFKDELLLFLSYFPSDIQDGAIQGLLDAATSRNLYRFISCRKALGVAIGDLSREWQVEIASAVLSQMEAQSREGVRGAPYVLEALSVALWRTPNLVLSLSSDQLVYVAEWVNPAVRDIKDRLLDGAIKEYERKSAVNTLCSHLELMLALLRTRKSEDRAVRRLFAPNGKYAVAFEQLIDDHVIPLLEKGVVAIDSKLELTLGANKPREYMNTPDLIYALKSYLSGDSGANTIIVARNNGGEKGTLP